MFIYDTKCILYIIKLLIIPLKIFFSSCAYKNDQMEVPK